MTAFHDLRDYIERLVGELGEGEVRIVEGANWDLEIGCLTELMAEREGPALLFDNIVGYPKGFRVMSNFMGTAARCAMALGISPNLSKVEIIRAWKDKSKQLTMIPPIEVASGPILENVLEGSAVDLTKFPAPKWHEHDGGRYIGTADLVITRDPDTGWVNMGTHRGCIQSKDRLSLWLLGDRHARMIASKYWKRGEACPIAVVFGCDPVLWTVGPTPAPVGVSEYDIAGALRGEPVEVLMAPGTGLPIPAHAEIVIEGEMPPIEEESAIEGPFGEWPGYYTHIGPETVIRVKRIMYRNDPIILGAPPMLPTTTPGYQALPLSSAVATWEHLESAGVPNIRGVWAFARNLMIVVSIEQRYEGQAMQALVASAGRRRIGGMERYFVVVDEDIDPSDLNQVLWAICTRVDPAESIQIMHTRTSDIDPRLSPKKRADKDFSMGIALIDACKPFAWKDQFAMSNRFDDAARAKVLERWKSKLPMLAETSK
ncbi:MAG: UbiD family decarboxylase [Candidatus Binataceae bacterium]|nr:UbiD family decarboxylase [Candidatus Binataceae bacterium]